MTYYQILEYFLIYSFLGWIVEVAYQAAVLGKVANRGFLNGPVCPIYGFGMDGILMLVHALNSTGGVEYADIRLLFLGGMILCTAIELFGGWLLDRLFHIRWWDYSNEKFNFHGYICPRFSLLWGLGTVLVVRFLHPLIRDASPVNIPERTGWIIMLVLVVFYLADLIVTVMTLVGLNRRFEEVEKARQQMRVVSDSLSVRIADSAMETQNIAGQAQVQAALGRQELAGAVASGRQEISEDLASVRHNAMNIRAESEKAVAERKKETEQRLEEIRVRFFTGQHSVANRLMRAFPGSRSDRHPELFRAFQFYSEQSRKQRRS